jgi:cytochrome c oxidase cbb3-type subunit 4
MSYEDVARFVQTWGLVFFVVVFLVAVAYALWPANRARFRRAARIPFEDDAGQGGREESSKGEPK